MSGSSSLRLMCTRGGASLPRLGPRLGGASDARQRCAIVDNRRSRVQFSPLQNHNSVLYSQYSTTKSSSLVKRLPNIITSLRIAGCPLLTYAIANDMKAAALCGCIAAGFTDWLDGYIAREYDAATPLGAFLDPLADKLFIGAVALGLTMTDVLPPLLTFVIVGRDVLLVSGSFYLRAKEKEESASFFDIDTTTFDVKPSLLSKVNTVAQFSVLVASLGHFVVGFPNFQLLEPLWYLTAATTIVSGLGYLSGSGLNRKDLFQRTDSSSAGTPTCKSNNMTKGDLKK